MFLLNRILLSITVIVIFHCLYKTITPLYDNKSHHEKGLMEHQEIYKKILKDIADGNAERGNEPFCPTSTIPSEREVEQIDFETNAIESGDDDQYELQNDLVKNTVDTYLEAVIPICRD